MSLSFRMIPAHLGYVGIVAGRRGLCRVFLPQPSAVRLRAAIRREFPEAIEDPALLPQLTEHLRRYFTGKATDFRVPLDWGGASAFLKAVWRACRRIGYGRTASYQELARRVGRPGAARAVGTAMRRNRWPIVVPCHRVVKGDGSLGGYSGPGGVAFKRRLLEMEAAARP